ncbi:TonB-dependent receptor [Flavivirga spongiicola]|uniref:TonB-dependent receptor n=1 Tax=Flavivirga spongiicola TaxID=421621 RepID=A0ABU7XLT9_9FLAO|nr:TonB-dependent receptor [Flavivirga sp. MEBiC05379]MDO5981398.1 TonB-dependent receptor [Flavivirga sp. MEBiC05379]
MKNLRQVKEITLTRLTTNLKMKLSILFLTLVLFQTHANTSYAQKTKISLDLADVSIEAVLDEIQKKSKFRFLVNVSEVDLNDKVSVHANKETIKKILTNLFKNRGIHFEVSKKQIILTIKQASAFPEAIDTNIQQTITGTVKDINGLPLVGANVLVKGTKIGAQSDFDGNFSMNIPDANATLVISFLGYATQEVPVNGQTVIAVTMEEDISGLDEVVVVGYGVQKRANLTGAVDNIDFEKEVGDRPVASVSQMLQGALPNLNFRTNLGGGEPGSSLNFNIRGIGTLTGNQGTPYILLDGIPISQRQMNTINPNDVKEITVLKDAASAAIYGARGAYGVILITTKNGTRTKGTTVSYSSSYGLATPNKLPEMANSLEFANTYNQGRINLGQTPLFDDQEIQDIKDYMSGVITADTEPNQANTNYRYWDDGYANYDWYDIMFKDNAPRQRHNVSVNGSGSKINYYLSGSIYEQEGNFTYAKEKYNRTNLTLNIENQATDWFKIGGKAKYSREKTNFPSGGFGGFDKNIIYHQISRMWPVNPLYAPDGTIFNFDVKRVQDSGTTFDVKNNTFLTLFAEVEPVKNWITKVTYNWTIEQENREIEQFRNLLFNPDGTTRNVGHNQNSISRRVRDHNDRLINLVSTYNFNLGLHNFSVLAGYEERVRNEFVFSGSRAGLITNSLPTFSTATGIQTVDDALFSYSTRGVFGRLNYNFDEKYLLEVNTRYDGSSFFREGNRFGFFPSVSAGYVLSKEDYWEPLSDVISFFKLRGSWGSLGNHDPELASRYQALMGSSQSSYIIDGDRSVAVFAPNLISPNLTWETARTVDFGFDARFLNNAFELNFDWYNRVTYDMVGPAQSLSAVLGTSPPVENNSELGTKGWELVLGWRGKIGEVGLNIKANLADQQSKVLSYPNETGTVNDWFAGRKSGEIYGLTTVGFFESDAAAASAPDQTFIFPNWGAGDIQYQDLNGDNKIDRGAWTKDDTGDYRVIGNTTPRYSYGLSIGVDYKRFNLTTLIQGVGKRDWSFPQSTNLFWGLVGSQWQSTIHKQALDYWTPENTGAYFPKPYLSGEHRKNTRAQTKYIQNASYMRLKNVQLSYSVPSSLLSRYGLSSLQLYISGENLLTITDLIDTQDPETLDGGFGDGKIYPLQRVFSTGINLTF